MNMYQKLPNACPVNAILAECMLVTGQEDAVLSHPLIKRFGNPLQSIYIDQSIVEINGEAYNQPLVLPIYDGNLNITQCAILQDEKNVQIIPEGLAKGFACFGELHKDKPVYITYAMETFFKIAQTGYAVVLVVIPKLCKKYLEKINGFNFDQIRFVIQELQKAGFKELYMPVRPENMDDFKILTENTAVKLLNQYIKHGESEFLTEFHKEDEIEEVKAFLDYSVENYSAYHWGELLPLSQNITDINHPYPIDALPKLAKEAAIAIAEHVQAPISMTAQCVIGAMSHIAQANVNAPHPFIEQGEPCSLYLLTEGQSGSRKSTCMNMADRAISKYEKVQYELYSCERDQWKSKEASLNKKERAAFYIESPEPNDPSTRFSDITFESIAALYVDNILQNASIASDEAGQFFGGHTMKGDTRNQAIGGFTKLFDDGFIQRSRSKSNPNGSGRAHDVRLTFNLQGQHEVLAEALKDPILRGQGFLARFILTIPENLAGTRFQDEMFQLKKATDDPALIAYWKRCEYLLDECPKPQMKNELHNGRYLMTMNEQAKKVDLKFYNKFEELQKEKHRYEYLQAFASRASQLARRLATIFAYFEGERCIDARMLTGAYTIIEHSLNAWLMYTDFEVKQENDTEKLLKSILKKCVNDKTHIILKTMAAKCAPLHLRKKKEFNECLDELIEFNYVRLITVNKSLYIELNPLLLKK